MRPQSATRPRGGLWAEGSRSLKADPVLATLEQPIAARPKTVGLIHHGDQGAQYMSMRPAERLKQAHLQSSVGTVGDAYENAAAESPNGLYKVELTPPGAPWWDVGSAQMADLVRVEWFNNCRLLAYVPAAASAAAFDRPPVPSHSNFG